MRKVDAMRIYQLPLIREIWRDAREVSRSKLVVYVSRTEIVTFGPSWNGSFHLVLTLTLSADAGQWRDA